MIGWNSPLCTCMISIVSDEPMQGANIASTLDTDKKYSYFFNIFYASVTHPSDAFFTFLFISLNMRRSVLCVLVQCPFAVSKRWLFPGLSSTLHFFLRHIEINHPSVRGDSNLIAISNQSNWSSILSFGHDMSDKKTM